MKVNREQFAENRRRILDAAGVLFRARGFESVTVADVMKAAGLTHGGFYGHFKSKDDLIVQALSHVFKQADTAEVDWESYVASYLSPGHRDNLALGCPVAGLAAEAIRQTPEARTVMTAGIRHEIEVRSRPSTDSVDPEAREAAIGSWAAMIGGVILARLVDDAKLSNEVLEATHSWIRRKDGK